MSLNIDALIADAKAEIVEPKTGDHEVVIAGKVVTFRFTKVAPLAWRELVGAFPPRAGVVRDTNLGYNFDAASAGFPAVAVVDGDDVVKLSPEQWRDLYGMFESPDMFAVGTLLWGIHEFEPSKAVEEAKKALTPGKSSRPRKS